MTVEDFQVTNEHAYMEVSLSDKTHGVIPLELYQHNIVGRDQHKDRRNPWYNVRYEVGKWSKFKIDIAFFRGVNESKKSYFAIDDIQVHNTVLSETDPRRWNNFSSFFIISSFPQKVFLSKSEV